MVTLCSLDAVRGEVAGFPPDPATNRAVAGPVPVPVGVAGKRPAAVARVPFRSQIPARCRIVRSAVGPPRPRRDRSLLRQAWPGASPRASRLSPSPWRFVRMRSWVFEPSSESLPLLCTRRTRQITFRPGASETGRISRRAARFPRSFDHHGPQRPRTRSSGLRRDGRSPPARGPRRERTHPCRHLRAR